jgi:hypothetical protein
MRGKGLDDLPAQEACGAGDEGGFAGHGCVGRGYRFEVTYVVNKSVFL